MTRNTPPPQPTALTEALAARYGAGLVPNPPEDLPAAAAQILHQILSHRTWRAFRPDPLPEGALELAIAAAQSAATSSNLQSWSVIAVRDAALKARLNAIAGDQPHVAQAPVLLVFLADLNRPRRVTEAVGGKAEALEYLESLVVGIVDAALAAQNAVLAFEAQGIGSSYIGSLRNDAHQVAELLGLPPEVSPVFGLAVGLPDATHPAQVKPRLPQTAVFFSERYDPAAALAPVAEYDTTLRAFQARVGQLELGWSRTVAERLRGPEALHGRENLRDFLRNLGFRLK
ncbi:NADPH-dependent oxidoreductase [Rhodobacter capsulatus]|uniref:NADPH-dependent oxidoreductase n=1 Tax=Rhodobacter capsulatus TaxID=1061 RepID=A0A4U1JLQ3_RHOCA|nr:nitroreductase family protein [Rhodobacter capsulatus]TKD14541.1 NADPH-dependent oxidoreductase [Rhodobacter capsulatus]